MYLYCKNFTNLHWLQLDVTELLELKKLQNNACDARIDNTCDLSVITEALRGLIEIDEPFAQLRNFKYWQVKLANISYRLMPIIIWVVPITFCHIHAKRG